MSNERRFGKMLFEYQTTTATDFRDGEIKPKIKTRYRKQQPPCVRLRPPPLKEIATLTDWKSPHVPFNVFGKPKDIVQTDPTMLQKRFDKPVDHKKELVRKTRPRLITTSIGSLDDFSDECRQFILDDVYITTTHKDLRTTTELAARNNNNVTAPLPMKAAPSNPITLPNLTLPYVSPEWRMDSASWENKQLRTDCDATKAFWLAKTSK